jgi:hypothetical protein
LHPVLRSGARKLTRGFVVALVDEQLLRPRNATRIGDTLAPLT